MMKVVSFPFSLLFFTSILQSMDEFDENKLPFEQHNAVRQWQIQSKAFVQTLASINKVRVNRKRSKLSASYLEREVAQLMKYNNPHFNPKFAQLSFEEVKPLVTEQIKKAKIQSDGSHHEYFVYLRISQELKDQPCTS